MEQQVFGREVELTLLDDFLDGLPGGSATIVVRGEDGIGKTVLWEKAIQAARARGYRLLSCRPTEAEADLPYSALAELIGDAADRLGARLPSPQRRALGAALMRSEPQAGSPDQLGVCLATHAVLEQAGREGPAVVAIDDFEWLDQPSRQALEFELRRGSEGRIGVVASTGTTAPPPASPDAAGASARQLELGPLSLGALHRMIAARSNMILSRPTLVRIHQAAGGNPSYALELVRAIAAMETDLPAGEPLPVSQVLHQVVSGRWAPLPPRTRRLLRMACALRQPTVGQLARASGPGEWVLREIDRAVEARVIDVHGELIRFTHPLLAWVPYSATTPRARRRIHARLAEVVDDPEERARHVGLAASSPDATIARALDVAARQAERRGAPAAAAELLERAIALTPPRNVEESRSRRLLASRSHFRAGADLRARELLERLRAATPAGQDRAEVLRALAEVRARSDSVPAAIDLYREALPEADGNLHLSARLELELALSLVSAGRLPMAAGHACRALRMAEEAADPMLLAQALAVVVMVDFLRGLDLDESRLEQALALEGAGTGSSLELRPSLIAGLLMMWTDRAQRGRSSLREVQAQALAQGQVSDLPFVLSQLTWAEFMRGDLAAAEALAEETYQSAAQAGRRSMVSLGLAARALVEAWRGGATAAKAELEQVLDHRPAPGWITSEHWCRQVLGSIALSSDAPDEADRALAPLVAPVGRFGLADPGPMSFLADEIEALIALDELARAETALRWLEERSLALQRRRPRAAAARCRALLLAAYGDLDEALAAVSPGVAEFQVLGMPLELGRTLLTRARIERRLRKWGAAKSSLEQAVETFERHGFVSWIERARLEHDRTGGRAKAGAVLTATESRVAEVIAAGHTVREAAGMLFLSPKTVEANLTRVYRKLGVGSRAALGALLGDPAASPLGSAAAGARD